jgi:hypothetical protein
MSDDKKTETITYSTGIGLPGATFLVLLTLKLLGKITITWFWVFAPLWLPVAAFFAILLVFGIGCAIVALAFMAIAALADRF